MCMKEIAKGIKNWIVTIALVVLCIASIYGITYCCNVMPDSWHYKADVVTSIIGAVVVISTILSVIFADWRKIYHVDALIAYPITLVICIGLIYLAAFVCSCKASWHSTIDIVLSIVALTVFSIINVGSYFMGLWNIEK